MSEQAEATPRVQIPFAPEADAVIAEFDGDARAAIAALLHDLDILANDAESTTSRGYVRGRILRFKLRQTSA
jgi:hypothetical protein